VLSQQDWGKGLVEPPHIEDEEKGFLRSSPGADNEKIVWLTERKVVMTETPIYGKKKM